MTKKDTSTSKSWRDCRQVLCLVGAGVVLLLAVMVIRREPTYEGKTVREWVWQYAKTSRQGVHKPPMMQQIGSRAIPLLVTELRRQNPCMHKLRFQFWNAAPRWMRQRMHNPYDVADAYMIREAAARTLGSLGAQARPAVPALQSALKDSTPHVRLAAACALWEVDSALADQVVPVLMELHNDPHNFKYYTSLYFGRIGARVAIPLLRETVNDPNPNIAANAKAALKKLELIDDTVQKLNE